MQLQPVKTIKHDEADCSLRLLSLMQEMAAQNTNAVLMLLADVGQLETERRYPDAGLIFGHGRWCAYYHCHENGVIHADEHGHFHIFTDIGDRAWAHVAGLSIDSEGQPLQWFAVNRWVTDGPWLMCEFFLEQLNYIAADEAADPVTDWLGILLQLYREQLFDLLSTRDQRLEQLSKACFPVEAKENREIYGLASCPIALQSTLEKHLLHRPADNDVQKRLNNNEH
jgi:hypothetical protein